MRDNIEFVIYACQGMNDAPYPLLTSGWLCCAVFIFCLANLFAIPSQSSDPVRSSSHCEYFRFLFRKYYFPPQKKINIVSSRTRFEGNSQYVREFSLNRQKLPLLKVHLQMRLCLQTVCEFIRKLADYTN